MAGSSIQAAAAFLTLTSSSWAAAFWKPGKPASWRSRAALAAAKGSLAAAACLTTSSVTAMRKSPAILSRYSACWGVRGMYSGRRDASLWKYTRWCTPSKRVWYASWGDGRAAAASLPTGGLPVGGFGSEGLGERFGGVPSLNCGGYAMTESPEQKPDFGGCGSGPYFFFLGASGGGGA